MSAEVLNQLRAGALRGAVRVDLSADLTAVPEEVRALADSLEVLNLSGNRLTDLPEWLAEMGKLRVVFCSNNPFRHVPEVLGRCPALEMIGFKSCQVEVLSGAALPPRLRWLILTDNMLAELPAELGNCPRLQKLMLSGNRLSALPESMAGCRKLELLRLASNQFAALPDWLMVLPRLSWLAIAGNPLTEADHGLEDESGAVPWRDLTIGSQLGEGASGQIFAGTWGVEPDRKMAVAVKLFKGAMTSDGLPASEMEASLAVGDHPALIGSLGRITAHPDGVPGLVMRRIGPEFCPLAGPPGLETCTRDVYPAGLVFSVEEARRIATAMAGAGAHLHGLHFLHGDFYGHNILVSPEREALLGDFGAAASTAGLPPERERALQQLEISAYGILLEELIERTVSTPEMATALLPLERLRDQCQDSAPFRRPDFPAILEALSACVK